MKWGDVASLVFLRLLHLAFGVWYQILGDQIFQEKAFHHFEIWGERVYLLWGHLYFPGRRWGILYPLPTVESIGGHLLGHIGVDRRLPCPVQWSGALVEFEGIPSASDHIHCLSVGDIGYPNQMYYKAHFVVLLLKKFCIRKHITGSVEILFINQ